jgi:hypothetical protein
LDQVLFFIFACLSLKNLLSIQELSLFPLGNSLGLRLSSLFTISPQFFSQIPLQLFFARPYIISAFPLPFFTILYLPSFLFFLFLSFSLMDDSVPSQDDIQALIEETEALGWDNLVLLETHEGNPAS